MITDQSMKNLSTLTGDEGGKPKDRGSKKESSSSLEAMNRVHQLSLSSG